MISLPEDFVILKFFELGFIQSITNLTMYINAVVLFAEKVSL